MAETWFYRIDGVVRGPALFAELKQLADSGQLDRGDFVRRESQSSWMRAGELGNLWVRLPTATVPIAGPPKKPAPVATPAPPPNESVNAKPVATKPAGKSPGEVTEEKLTRSLARAFAKPAAPEKKAAPKPRAAAEKLAMAAPLAEAEPATREASFPETATLRRTAPRKRKVSRTARLCAMALAIVAIGVGVYQIATRTTADVNQPAAVNQPAVMEPPAQQTQPQLATEQTLPQLAGELNAQAPRMLGTGVRCDAVVAGPGTLLSFNCTLTEVDVVAFEFDKAAFIRDVKPMLVTMARTGPQRSYLKNHGVEVRYQFRDKNAQPAATVTIAASEL